MTAIQLAVLKLLYPQAFRAAILENGRLWLVPPKNISEEKPSQIGHM